MSGQYALCSLCQNPVEFACAECKQYVCGIHGRIRILCTSCLGRTKPLKDPSKYTLGQATCDDVPVLEEFVVRFWGDPVQLMFDQLFTVVEQPAIVAKNGKQILGFVFYHPFRETDILIVALGVLPQYQGCGIGSSLLQHIEDYAKSEGKKELLVVTSNDNLPALAFYQGQGFQLYEVVPNVIAHKLGKLQPGIGNIPIRDELRLRKPIKEQ